jgi:hypothetical protein
MILKEKVITGNQKLEIHLNQNKLYFLITRDGHVSKEPNSFTSIYLYFVLPKVWIGMQMFQIPVRSLFPAI